MTRCFAYPSARQSLQEVAKACSEERASEFSTMPDRPTLPLLFGFA